SKRQPPKGSFANHPPTSGQRSIQKIKSCLNSGRNNVAASVFLFRRANLSELREKQYVVEDLHSASHDKWPSKRRQTQQVARKKRTDRGSKAAGHRGNARGGRTFFRRYDSHHVGSSRWHVHLRQRAPQEKKYDGVT